MIKVKEITAEDTYEIRHTVLRPTQTIDACKYEEDHFRNTFHLGVFLDDTLISIASFFQERNPAYEEINQYRLIGMATLEEYRGKKAGSALLNYGEKVLKQRQARLLWCNARFPVSDYYRSFGMQEEGKVFVIDSIGPHKVMYKLL